MITGLAVWLSAAFVVALVVGKAMRIADEIDAAFADYQVERPVVVVGPWAA